MSQPAQKIDMRASMPNTADWIARKRLDWGKDHVNDCLRRATADKQQGFFYAMEAGHVIGTPFPADHPAAEAQRYAVLNGCGFAVFMLKPLVVPTAAQGAAS